MLNNGDTQRLFNVGGEKVVGLGSFHKTLPHNKYGEVDKVAFTKLVEAGNGSLPFSDVPKTGPDSANLTNPQAGLAHDRLVQHPSTYSMPPAPRVLSVTTAAEMTELYWMALLRDVSFDAFNGSALVGDAATEIDKRFRDALGDQGDAGRLTPGVDVPGSAARMTGLTPQNVFRIGLPGEEMGPMVSQFFIRDINFGTQRIDQTQRPYKTGMNFLTDFSSWLTAQRSGRDADGQDYSKANEHSDANFETPRRYISSMRDLARFVNKDALHQAYFNAALLLLSGGASWTPGNPYTGNLGSRENGFGVLGGPHILALVSEVATRALKVVWNQKWQTHLRLRPEAYGGLVHVQNIGIGSNGDKRPYGLPSWVSKTLAAKKVKQSTGSLLLPMAFTPGSPTHPAYGAGHATVAGACVTVLKAYFRVIDDKGMPILLKTLKEKPDPFGMGVPFASYVTGVAADQTGTRTLLPKPVSDKLTIEGELNKLAANVAMGRSMGGVHWRTDNTRSLALGEALAARILADITVDVNEKPEFVFRTFGRRVDGEPKTVTVRQGRIYVDGVLVDTNASAL